ncbi:response regulator [Pedobacter flavus]|uniref:Response regulator n=1 Tax=Pedobacter flavus TaxID=3113906 RepID=A0ABU7H0D8_9SPHI|nr:response regulator [Pedobacter sp. VNH31]MEE1884498.1 response regulator [Pedobacter sp. VNH31]
MKGKILIIDDDSRNIFALQAVLKSKGFKSSAALDALNGIEILEKEGDYDLVFMDMMMPELDGYEAISIIKHKEPIKQIPIIALTAQAMQGDREKCLNAGASDYLSKPVNIDELLKIISKWID